MDAAWADIKILLIRGPVILKFVPFVGEGLPLRIHIPTTTHAESGLGLVLLDLSLLVGFGAKRGLCSSAFS